MLQTEQEGQILGNRGLSLELASDVSDHILVVIFGKQGCGLSGGHCHGSGGRDRGCSKEAVEPCMERSGLWICIGKQVSRTWAWLGDRWPDSGRGIIMGNAYRYVNVYPAY